MPKKITADIIESIATNLDIAALVEDINSSSGVVTSNGAGGAGHLSQNTAFNKNFGSSAGEVCEGNDSRLGDSRTPTTHATTHQSGGADAIKLDDLAAPDDNTDLDATASLHGLMAKADKSKLDGIEANATADQTDVEIEAAYNNQVSQVSAPEIAAGTEAGIRRYAPADIKGFIDAHVAGAGIQNNLSATTSPSVTDDSGAGYTIGSVWINTTSDEAFRCVDASSGAAVWVNTTLTTSELATLAVTGDWSDIQNKPSAFTPDTHATTHQSGGADAIKLDDLAAPDDNTDLDATASLHGLMPKVDKSKLDAIESSATANPNAVDGPASATDQQIPVFDGTTGKLLKSIAGLLVDGNGIVNLPSGLKIGVGTRPAISAAYDGVFWYSKDGNTSSLDFGVQISSTPTYGWQNIFSYSWDS